MDKISSPNIMVALNEFQEDVTCIHTKHKENMTSAYYVYLTSLSTVFSKFLVPLLGKSLLKFCNTLIVHVIYFLFLT